MLLKVCHYLLLISFIWCSTSKVYVNPIFSNGLVLQANKESGYRSFVYGTADPYEQIKIEGTIQGANYSTTANKNGEWKVEINPQTTNNITYNMQIIGDSNMININNIKMGDIFICIGDENMLFPMSEIRNASYEISKSSLYPSIKILSIPSINSNIPQNGYPSQLNIKWEQANPSTLPSFSSICYLSAQKLLDIYGDHRNMGLIQVAVNKSTLNCWMSQNSIKQSINKCNNISTYLRNICNDSTLFNGMINPLIGLTSRSYIYYQGSNELTSKEYGCKFGIMINTYRDFFRSGDFPFAFVQLNSMNVPNNNTDLIGNIRMEQTINEPKTNGSVDITGMILSYDLGLITNKTEIAKRIALKLARISPVILYDHNSSLYDGPYIDYAIYDIIGNSIILNFTNFNASISRLIYYNTTDCNECCNAMNIFELSVDNIKWINSSSFMIDKNVNNSIIISLNNNIDNITNIQYIRYGHSSFVECALYRNGNTIPVAPFLIDINNQNVQEKIKRENILIPMGNIVEARVAQTPPMGFNTWNFAHCNIDERLVKQVANFMIKSGLRDAGYEYFNLDDCWQTDRDYTSQIILADSVRYPSGIKSLADWLKHKQFKFGIYTARAQYTCQNRYGSYMREYIDVQTYCDWGVDYIKVDICHGEDYQYPNQSWIKFREAIDKCYNTTGQDMVLCVETCTTVTGCGQWVGNIANVWGAASDIQDNWNSIMKNADHVQGMYSISGPGHWNDADMLEIGNPGLSLSEEKVHFSLWAIIASPLLIGTNLLEINNDSLSVLLNKEIIAVSQDVLGIQGHKLYANISGSEVWFRPLINDNVAVCLLNRMNTNAADITVKFSDVGIPSNFSSIAIRDLWLHENIAMNITADSYTYKNVQSHTCAMIKLIPDYG